MPFGHLKALLETRCGGIALATPAAMCDRIGGGVPFGFYMSNHPITHRFLALPLGWGERTVFASAAGTLSFAELVENMRLFAGWLGQVAGVGRGDRVAVCLPKSLEAVQIVFGVLHAGATYAPLPFHSP